VSFMSVPMKTADRVTAPFWLISNPANHPQRTWLAHNDVWGGLPASACLLLCCCWADCVHVTYAWA
jgi:hypothetical protein